VDLMAARTSFLSMINVNVIQVSTSTVIGGETSPSSETSEPRERCRVSLADVSS